MKRLNTNFIKWLLPVLFIGYMSATSFFKHTHFVNGVVVEHSHPFKKDRAHDHQNDAVEIYAIQSLSTISAADGAVCLMTLNSIIPAIEILRNDKYLQHPPKAIKGKLYLRPPPVLLSLS